ncbi:MAG: helix-turn-helix transcriptional regulator [Methylotenera sp.]|nr:helix-turn-helix transcriptional regulator [Methylotenera sp.]
MKLEEVFALRMRKARLAAGLTQEALGVLVGIDEATAKVRMNQYESGRHTPPLSMIEKIASTLARPVTWFICSEDTTELHLALNKLDEIKRSEVISSMIELLEAEATR